MSVCVLVRAVQTLSKVQILEQSLLEKARQTVLLELQEELMQRTRKLKKNLLDTADALHSSSSLGTSELRRKYAAMTTAAAAMGVSKSAATVCRPPTAQVRNPGALRGGGGGDLSHPTTMSRMNLTT